MTFAEESSSVLAEYVQRFRVCWEVWPEYLMSSSGRRQVGFELELSGTPEFGSGQESPGTPECRKVYVALHAIADWIFPKEERPSMYEIEPYEHALHYSSARSNRPDVTLSVKILHRSGFDQPVDACEVRCLQEMEQRLIQLGARQRQWPGRKSSHS